MISIIIPIYNREKILHKTFDSLLAQTEQNIEVIAVDDGSTDQSGQVARDYEQKFKEKNIPYQFISKENGGAPSARNCGFGTSKGEYILFCDADAVLKPQALELLLKKLKSEPNAAYAYPSFLWGKKLFKVGPFDREKLKNGPCIHTMALVRRECFPAQGWDRAIKKLQDWDLWLTMLEQGKTGVWLDEVLFQIEPGGTISSWLPSFAYKLLPFLPSVKKYKNAVRIVKEKHGLNNN